MISITQSVCKQITEIFNRRKRAIGLSGYAVGELIGQGGSANVYRISGRAGSPDYVLRISEEQRSPYSNDVYNLRELDILQELRRISQPHVVQYVDAFIADIPGCPRYYCAVMKRLVPLNKYRIAADGVEIAVRLGSDLLPLLQSFADKEILHRDIKPENIFFDGSFRNPTGFLLGDFGIAKRDSSTSITPSGTESTIAPEVRGLDRSLPKDRSRSDMYSLGIVMYRYLNEGVYPSNRERIDKMPPDKKQFPEPRFGSKRLKQLVIKATSYNPDDRFDSPQDMLRELQRCEEYTLYIEQGGADNQPTFVPPQNMPFPQGAHVPQQMVPSSVGFPQFAGQGAGMVPAQKVPVRKNQGTSFLKNKVFLISTVSVAAVLMLIIGVAWLNKSDLIELGERNFHKNSENYLYFREETVSMEFAEKVSQFKALKTLKFEDCRFESGAFGRLTGMAAPLQTLSVKGCTGIDDYSAVSSLDSLQYLTLSGCDLADKQLSAVSLEKHAQLRSVDLSENAGISDLSCLKQAVGSLWELDVSGTSVKDFSLLNGGKMEIIKAERCGLTDSNLQTVPYETIHRLNLSHNKLSNISALNNAREITSLDLSYNKIRDISPLSACVRLDSLSLAHNSVADISALFPCTALTSVDVSYNNLNGLAGLEQSIYLKKISAAHNQLSSIDGLVNCTQLEYVDLNNNRLSEISILSKSAEKLKTVLLDCNSLKNISALNNTVSLKYISADENELKSLSPLKQSTALKGISASGNAIGNLEPICNAKELQYVYLSHNLISSVPDEFRILQKLRDVDLSNNYIRSGDFLAKSLSNYNLMALYGNPVDSVSGTSGKGNHLIISYHEKIDFARLNKGFFYYDIVNCPLDKQVEVKEKLSGIVSYVTAEEAANMIKKYYELNSAE